MYEIVIRDMDNGEVHREKSEWVTAQWTEGDEVAVLSLGSGTIADHMKRCIALDEFRKMLLKDAKIEPLWALKDALLKGTTVVDLGEIKRQMGK